MNRSLDTSLIDAINDSRPVGGLSHTLYKYPARFSPLFAREVISLMTRAGDVVLDPFVGGGTSLVEAMATGRDGIGLDINELAVFVAKVKSTVFGDAELARVSRYIDSTSDMTLNGRVQDNEIGRGRYHLNMDRRNVWRVRDFLALCLSEVQQLESKTEENLARCILLRTAQWALDCRKETPAIEQFRDQLKVQTMEATSGAREFRTAVKNTGRHPRALCVLRSAIGSELDERIKQFGRPALVITSPPYPGVHVLYHRWQVQGRRETAAPYWIANLNDGQGACFYTFADRNRADLAAYLRTAEQAFGSVRQLVSRGTPLVQMVAFAHPERQLVPYLDMLNAAGWNEMNTSGADGRLWRTVPGRKWYTSLVKSRANRELVLFHTAG